MTILAFIGFLLYLLAAVFTLPGLVCFAVLLGKNIGQRSRYDIDAEFAKTRPERPRLFTRWTILSLIPAAGLVVATLVLKLISLSH